MKKTILCMILLIPTVLMSCGNTVENNASGSSSAMIASESYVETNSSAAIDAESSLGDEIEFSLGDEIELGNWHIIISSAKTTNKVFDNYYAAFNSSEGNKYLVIDVSITNNGKNAATFLPTLHTGNDISATVLYKSEYEYPATNLIGYSKEIHDMSINPLSTKSGSITFEIPDIVASSGDVLTLILKQSDSSRQILFSPDQELIPDEVTIRIPYYFIDNFSIPFPTNSYSKDTDYEFTFSYPEYIENVANTKEKIVDLCNQLSGNEKYEFEEVAFNDEMTEFLLYSKSTDITDDKTNAIAYLLVLSAYHQIIQNVNGYELDDIDPVAKFIYGTDKKEIPIAWKQIIEPLISTAEKNP